MYWAPMPIDADAVRFRAMARRCLTLDIAPPKVSFASPDAAPLFDCVPEVDAPASFSVPKAYAELLKLAICHQAPDRFSLLYDVLWRIRHGETSLADNPADAAVARLNDYARNVRRDIHKMHAFLRFREQRIEDRTVFTSWFEPKHFILHEAVPFFVDRFSTMEWFIATPIGTAAWNGSELVYGPPAERTPPPADAVLDETWLTYYRTTFNPARLRLKAMATEMPRHYWANMPETQLIPAMVAGSGRRLQEMAARAPDLAPRFAGKIAARPAAPLPPVADALSALKEEIAHCRRCPLHCAATQAVPGEGPADAALMLVGEQPGDAEDLAGRPFVGPAGQLLDRALAEAGLERDRLYLTNAVKHFKYEPRGKRRIHQRPNAGEVQSCKWWLNREIALVRPRLIVALGATAAGALSGRAVSVTKERGPMLFGEAQGFVMVHPSFLLRLPDDSAKEREYRNFVADLGRVASA